MHNTYHCTGLQLYRNNPTVFHLYSEVHMPPSVVLYRYILDGRASTFGFLDDQVIYAVRFYHIGKHMVRQSFLPNEHTRL